MSKVCKVTLGYAAKCISRLDMLHANECALFPSRPALTSKDIRRCITDAFKQTDTEFLRYAPGTVFACIGDVVTMVFSSLMST